MNKYITKVAIPAAALLLTCLSAPGQINLTDISIFSASSTGGYDGNPSSWDYWNSRSGEGYADIWIQNPGGAFLNGPTESTVRPKIPLTPGVYTYRLAMSPGADWPNYGINLFFNTSNTPSISAYCPIRVSAAPTNFWANGNVYTLRATSLSSVPSAGTLSFISGDKRITLTDFFIARPAVYGIDIVQPFSTAPDGLKDYIGGITLRVDAFPRASIRVSEVEISWPTETNMQYQVEYKSSLTTNTWQQLTDPINGTGTNACIKDALPTAEPQRYYRVITLP